jgi:hypothetical protein
MHINLLITFIWLDKVTYVWNFRVLSFSLTFRNLLLVQLDEILGTLRLHLIMT